MDISVTISLKQLQYLLDMAPKMEAIEKRYKRLEDKYTALQGLYIELLERVSYLSDQI